MYVYVYLMCLCIATYTYASLHMVCVFNVFVRYLLYSYCPTL